MTLTIFFSSPGTYYIDDDGVRGNGASVVRDSSGNILFPFTHPTDTMTFIAEVPGINFVFNVTDTFGTANVFVGDLAASSSSPDSIVINSMRTDGFMTLVSNGSITERGSDAAADLVASGLTLSAGTGVGTAGNAIETQVTFIEGETNSGGINIANFGSVQIGGLSADVSGLNVVSSGDINFSTTGFIVLSDATGASSVHGGDISGNVTLTAIGADSDIFSAIDRPAIYAAGGGVTLNAGRDIGLGTSGSNFNNDVLATGDIAINAGRDFVIDGTSNVRTGAFGGVVGGDIAITAGRNVSLTNGNGGLQTIEAFAGDITLTSGPGGTFLQDGFFSSAIQTTGNILVNADNVLISNGGLNTTGIGSVTIRPVSAGRAIDLGTNVDPAGALGLSDAEFDRLFTLNVNIGSATTGDVTISAPLTPFIVDNLTVQSGNDILVSSSLSLPRTLTLRAGNDIFFTPGASFSSALGGLVAFVDNAQADDGAGGLGDIGGTLSVATSIQLAGSVDADTLRGSAASDILDGAAGADVMIGRAGDDTYMVDNAGDSVAESAGEGIDRILTSVSYALAPAVEVEQLMTTAAGGTSPINLTGNELNNAITGNAGVNTLTGGAGNDTLDGRVGTDTLKGGLGDDTYIVENAGDVVIEGGGAGTDLVKSSVTFTLGAAIENLTLTGSAAINGTGNTVANVITGNGAANVIDGGAGADTMKGGLGNDTYVVAQAGDVVTETASAGTDVVQSSVSFTLGANVENLTLTGASAINGNGNGLANLMTGNGAANSLIGGAGTDTLNGAGGNDTLDGGADRDIITGGTGADTFLFRAGGTGATQADADKINDFTTADGDKIDLHFIDANVFTGGNAAFSFIGTSAFSNTAGELRYEVVGGFTFISGDMDGDGTADMMVRLVGSHVMAASDFVL